ncbi:hypothetical protein [Streptomyces fuscigenes]|uniref:hypothetical protein n=1 Tax=Streptomyces fuscigenes TaxID=1528880 RepID=UPI001F403CB7|nr:hypothetical protein [Streptomyces fuscigenes]MCF3960318.1 hypothetical protein [Streptomyces fuscigenes]
MTITRLTPEETRAVSAALARTCAYVRHLMDQLREFTRRAVQALQEMAEAIRTLRRPPAAVAGPARPAWMSPYGPPAKRHR